MLAEGYCGIPVLQATSLGVLWSRVLVRPLWNIYFYFRCKQSIMFKKKLTESKAMMGFSPLAVIFKELEKSHQTICT